MNFTNTLRNYYSIFGIENEGPDLKTNIDDIIPISKNILSELSILNSLLNNQKYKTDFSRCNSLLEELANKLSKKAHFMEELSQIKDQINIDIEGITNGVIWFSQAHEIDPRHNNIFTKNENDLLNPDAPINKSLKMQGSLILQLYIALVYMRSGPVSDILKIGALNKCQVMNTYKKLFNSDYIRHIRNSLSHGTFKINIAGVYFKDDSYTIVATPGFLDKICTWLFMIYYQCVLFAEKELNNSKS